jgi:hypothetical protein
MEGTEYLDCRLVVRCAVALVRKHSDLVPDKAAAIVTRLSDTAASAAAAAAAPSPSGSRGGPAARWQRFMAVQALRAFASDPQLLYR